MIPGASTDNTKANDTVIPKKHRRDSDGNNDEIINVERKKATHVLLKELNIKPHMPAGRGKPGDLILEKLTIKYVHKKTGKPYYSCIAINDGCYFIRSGNAQKDRVFPHAAHCNHVSDELRHLVDATAAQSSLGAKIGSGSQAVAVAPSDLEPKDDIVAHCQNKTSKSQKPATKFEIDVTRIGAEQLPECVNHAIVKLLCVCGVPPTIVDSDEWKTLMHTLNPRYCLTPSTQFVEKFIPREAAHVHELTAERLQEQDNLTLTFDGNSTRNADSIYLVHYTMPDDRKSYLVHGYKGSDERHTREWVKGIIVKTIKDIGIDKTAAIVSDSMGNTRAGWQDAQREIPILLNLGDCCHHIQLTVQDINRIGDFQEFIKTLNTAIRFFTKSNFSLAHLKKAREDVGLGQGLIKIGKTCFITHWSASVALEKNLELIKELVRNEMIKPNDKTIWELFKENVPYRKFQSILTIYIKIIKPLARALWSLESLHTNAADVYIFWLAITAKLRKLFSKGEAITGITPSISSAVSTIVSHHFKAFVNESPTDIYFTTFFLHPSYSTSDTLLRPASVSHTIRLPARAQNQPLPTVEIPYPNAFKRAKEYLKKILCDEAEYYKANPMMPQSPIGQIICKLGEKAVVNKFRTQIQPMHQQTQQKPDCLIESVMQFV
ncbi:ribonuclease H-like domain-containing protein [Amanita rubescens]|nr:ribonuclease H-like domain-containing protein [Amanita rubescens]